MGDLTEQPPVLTKSEEHDKAGKKYLAEGNLSAALEQFQSAKNALANVAPLGNKWGETSSEWHVECFHQLALVDHHIGVTYTALAKSKPQGAAKKEAEASALVYADSSIAQFEALQRHHLEAFFPPTQTALLYNLACAHALKGDGARASEAMYGHLKAGLDNLTRQPGDEDFIDDLVGTRDMLRKDADLQGLAHHWGDLKLDEVGVWITQVFENSELAKPGETPLSADTLRNLNDDAHLKLVEILARATA